MHKHQARMTERRRQILKLIAKGYKNERIAKEMGLSLSNTKLQKWRLYCYLCVNTAIDAVYVGLEQGLLSFKELSKSMKGKIKDAKTNKQMYDNTKKR